MGCKPKVTSGCIKEKYIQYLNDKFPQLPFEFGCVLDEAFLKILEELRMKCLYECDETGTTFWTKILADGTQEFFTDSSETTPYEPVGKRKPAPTDRPSADIEPTLVEAEDQNGLCIWVKKVEGIGADGVPFENPPRYFTEPDCLNEVTTADFVAPLTAKMPKITKFEEINNAKESIEVTDEVVALNPPADATGARVTVEGCIRACSDGTVPTPTTGTLFGNGGLFRLGCMDADTVGNDPDQVAQFQAIADAGKSGTITVTYFKKVTT